MSTLDRIQSLMSAYNMTAKQLVIELGLYSSAISDWKRGKALPSYDAIIKISQYFNISSDYLLCLTDDPNKTIKYDGNLSIESRVDEILSGLDNTDNTLMLDGMPVSPESVNAFRNAVMVGIEMARRINKQNEANNVEKENKKDPE